MFCLSDPSTTPRPNRIINLLNSMGCEVDVCATQNTNPIECAKYFVLDAPKNTILSKVFRKLCRFPFFLYRSESLLRSVNNLIWGLNKLKKDIQLKEYQAVFVEDIDVLPFAFDVIERKEKIIFDAREYFPEEISGNVLWRVFLQKYRKYLCEKYLKQCKHVLTVSNGLRDLYKKNYAIDALLFRSVPQYSDIIVKPLKADKIRMVHHGLANPDRCLETMIDVFDGLDYRYELHFYLKGNTLYINRLKERAKNFPNIKFHNPVVYKNILPMLEKYDIGFYLLKPSGPNTQYALPNKLFEFIQARLAVVIGPSMDMANIVNEFKCGFVADNFIPKEMTNLLNKLSQEDIDTAKKQSNVAAKVLCYEEESKKIINLINDIRYIEQK